MLSREILITSKITTYNELLEAFKYIDRQDIITIITKDYSNIEKERLRNLFYIAKSNNIKFINDYSDFEINELTKYKLNENINVKKYDIIKFYGINDFIETGIIKCANNDDEYYEIQTLDNKSIIYNGSYKIIEAIGNNKKFSFSNKKFHTFNLGQKFKLNFTNKFVCDYTQFYENNFNLGIDEQLKDFENIWNLKLNNIYDLEIFAFDGRYSYCCILNNMNKINTFIIHEDLIKNHVIQLYN